LFPSHDREGFQISVFTGSGKITKAIRSVLDVTTELLNRLTDYNKTTKELSLDEVAKQMLMVNTIMTDQLELQSSLSEEEKKINNKEKSELIQQRIDALDAENRILNTNINLQRKGFEDDIEKRKVLDRAIFELNQLKNEELELEKKLTEEKKKKVKVTQEERETLGTLKEKLKELKAERELIATTNTKALDKNKKAIETLEEYIKVVDGTSKATKDLKGETVKLYEWLGSNDAYMSSIESLEKLKEEDKKLADEQIKNKQRVLDATKIASDAIFTIMSDNTSRQASRDEKMLEERKDAGLITEQEYEKGVERIQRKAFERKKRMDIAQVLIDTALAIAKSDRDWETKFI